MKDIKQNKNSFAIRVLSMALAVFVLFFSLCVPSFGYVDNWDGSFTPLPVLSSVPTAPFSNATLIYNIGGYQDQRACAYTSGDVYSFGVGTTGGLINIYFVSKTANSSIGTFMYHLNSHQSTVNTETLSSTSGDWYYFKSWGFYESSTYRLYVPVYPTLQDGLDALDSSLNPVISHSLNTTLPAGNAIIIDVTGNNAEALSLSSTSALRHKDNWSDGNQMMGYFSSAPSSLASPFEGTHSITWRGVGSPNLFDGYNSWNTTAPLLPTGKYLVIVNPAYPNDNPDSITSNQASNGAIIISCGFCLSAQIVPLSSSWSNGSIVSSSGNLRLDGEYDPNTDSWTFNNSATGEPQNPVSGGLTDVDAEHITINDWLQNISHQIGSFFAGAIGAVSTLVSAGSDFIHSLSGLYAWLPAPVYSVLVSALILVITIGVIKVFI